MVRAVLFDIDNTLLDFDACVKGALREGFEKFGLGAYDESMFPVFVRINSEMWRELEQGRLSYDELWQNRFMRVFSALGVAFDGCVFEEYFRNYLFCSAIPVAHAADILAYLKGRYMLCVASNGPYAQQVNRLRLGGMLAYFSKLFISEQVGASKPSELFFAHCMSEMNAERRRRGEQELQPGEIIMIGDSLSSDMAGAAAYGMQTCFFCRDEGFRAGDMAMDHVIHSLDEIRSFL